MPPPLIGVRSAICQVAAEAEGKNTGEEKRLTFPPILSSTITPTSDVYPSFRLENSSVEAILITDGGGERCIPLFYLGIDSECQ